MPSPLSPEFRDQIQDHFLRLNETAFIRKATGVSTNQINKIRKYWENIGLIIPPHSRPGLSILIIPRITEDLLE